MGYAYIRHRFFRVLSVAVCVSLMMSGIANATPYGSNPYNSCVYNCPPRAAQPTAPTQTVTVTPTGLEVSVNLVDGQKIPKSGYTIVVTPLNGTGTSFKSVTIYLDSRPVFNGAPDATGTLRWDWDAGRFPASVVKIDIEDQNGSITSKQYKVAVVDDAEDVTELFNPVAAPGAGESLLSNAVNSATQLVKALPKPVVYGFPYFLLLLLAINILIILFHAYRELAEYRILTAILARGKTVAASKRTLAQLVSHYLRTPLTLMMGGVDMLKQDASLQTVTAKFEPVVTRLHLKIEGLIAQTIEESTVTIDSIGNGAKQAGVLRQPGLLIPLIVIPLLVIPFNFLASRAGTFTLSQVNIAAQLIVFSILIVLLYTLLRYAALKRRDREKLAEIMKAESAVQASRDTLIAQTAAVLEEEIASIDALVAETQQEQASGFIKNGEVRLKDILSKLRVASRLKGAHTQAEAQMIQFTTLVNPVYAQLQAKAAEKQITLTPVYEHTLALRSPELVAYVLANLIDNAIAYSHEQGKVEVSLEDSADYHIKVTDHGAGIAKERLALLFQPFSKAEGAEVFTHEGMGFSLYLDSLIAQYLDGSITIDSEPDVATVVRLRLPKAV